MRRISRAHQKNSNVNSNVNSNSDGVQPLDDSSGRSIGTGGGGGGGGGGLSPSSRRNTTSTCSAIGSAPSLSLSPNRDRDRDRNRLLLGNMNMNMNMGNNLPSVPIAIGSCSSDEMSMSDDQNYNHACINNGNNKSNINMYSRWRGGANGANGVNVGRPRIRNIHLWLKKIALVVAVLSGLHLAFRYYERQHDIQLRLDLERNEFEPVTEELYDKLKDIKDQRAKLQKQIDQESIELVQLRKRTTEDIPTLQKQIADLKASSKAYKDKMHAAIQEMSRKRLLEKFGPGPYYVVMDLSFDPLANVPGNEHFIAMELASANEMPHSVYWFLEQVSNELFDGSSFHRNAGHIVQCGPAPNFLTAPGVDLPKRFTDAGFTHVLFQEYSPKYAHNKYTIGYAGRPSGPDFYINIRDNIRAHGPGGQKNVPNPEDADPCFGRVIEGFDTVNRLHKSPVRDSFMHMEHNVAVTKMTWMTKEKFDEWKRGRKGEGEGGSIRGAD